MLFGLFYTLYTLFCFAKAVFIRIELFIIYRFRFDFIAPGISPLDSFRLQKIVIAKIRGEHTRYFYSCSENYPPISPRIYLVHRLPILRVMLECSTGKYVPFRLASELIKYLHRHPLGFVINRLNTSASLW